MDFYDTDDYDLDGRLYEFLNGKNSYDSFDNDDDYDEFDQSIDDIDFSQIEGDDFKKSFSKVNQKIQKVIVPEDRKVIVEGVSKKSFVNPQRKQQTPKRPVNEPIKKAPRIVGSPKRKIAKSFNREIGVEKSATIFGARKKIVSKVIVPDDRPVIVEGVSNFIIKQDHRNDAIKKIGYKDGRKLKELILQINNETETDFVFNLFDPSMPLDYFYSTGQNLNDRINVTGGLLQYSDVCFNILANSPIIHSAYFTLDGPNGQLIKQQSLAMQFFNKDLRGYQKVDPLNMSLKLDIMQVFNNVIAFDFKESLNRPFIPDGLDTISYTIFAGMNVTMCFFYEQIQIKKVFYEEARESKKLL